jgi:hypothetical protein
MKTTLENREFGHTARSTTSRFSFAGSSLNSNPLYDLSVFLPGASAGVSLKYRYQCTSLLLWRKTQICTRTRESYGLVDRWHEALCTRQSLLNDWIMAHNLYVIHEWWTYVNNNRPHCMVHSNELPFWIINRLSTMELKSRLRALL